MWRWLRAGFGTRWGAGRWRGGGSDPGQRLPATDRRLEREAGQLRGRGGTRCQGRCQRCPRARGSRGASFPLFSSQEQPRSSPCWQTRGVCHFLVSLPRPPSCTRTSQEHPMALSLSCPRGPPGARTGVTQEGDLLWGCPPSLCFLMGPLGVPAEPRHFRGSWGAPSAAGARRRGWRGTQLGGSPLLVCSGLCWGWSSHPSTQPGQGDSSPPQNHRSCE